MSLKKIMRKNKFNLKSNNEIRCMLKKFSLGDL